MSGTAPDLPREPIRGAATHDISPAAQISNLVVGLLRTYTGRGPTRARTSIDGDLVSVVLRDALTTGERSLMADGRGQLVLEVREAYQMSMRHDLVAGVEAITGQTVIAFLSANHTDPDIAVESFVLEAPRRNGASEPPGDGVPDSMSPPQER